MWQAKQKCRNLVVVPPHFEEYIKYSKLARSVYSRYTDQVEPYGMDECWLDVSGTENIFGSPEKVANDIRETVKFELGLTISVGVSFNKIFAKLGSDIVTWNWGSIDMTMLEAFVKERNEALFSLDRKKIEAYMIKYGETEIAQTPDVVFWASVYKAICGVKDALEAIVSKAKAWLHEHGMSPNLAG